MRRSALLIKRKLRLGILRLVNIILPVKNLNEVSKRKESPPLQIKNNLDLISIHIPKTAGTSLYKILGEVYGKRNVARVDYRPHINMLFLNERKFSQLEIPENVRVIHGHINPRALERHIELKAHTKIIIWVRDPIERVISDYYYMMQIVDQNFNFDPLNPNVLPRVSRSLIEFARQEKEQNRMARFIGKLNLEDLYFVGITESFAQDMKCLSHLLGWESYTLVNRNRTKNKSKNISPEIIEEIKLLNKKDVELYNKALKINKRHRENLSVK